MASNGAAWRAAAHELQLGVTWGLHLEQGIFAAIVQFHGGDGLRVAAIEAFSETEDGRQSANARRWRSRQIARNPSC